MPFKKDLKKKAKLSPAAIAYLSGGDGSGLGNWDAYRFACFAGGSAGLAGDPNPRELWERHRGDFLPAFIKAHPGRRPLPWWQWDAPREEDQGSGYWYEGTLPKQRRRTGGDGATAWEVDPEYVPEYRMGVPLLWGWVDPENPPRFESEAAYLDRHGLLTPAEVKHLRDHPELLSEELIITLLPLDPEEDEDEPKEAIL